MPTQITPSVSNATSAAAPAPHRYDAIFWDNDGVLVDTEKLYFQTTREALAGVGIELTEALYFLLFLVGSGGTWELVRQRGVSASDMEVLRVARNERYRQELERNPLVIDGVRETLMALQPHYRMGIVTSSRRDHFETIHRRTGLLPFFEFVIAQGDYANSKPEPDPYLAAIARCGVAPERCLAIEDTPRGLQAARRAGIDCVVIPTPLTRHADFSAATHVLGSVSQLPALLQAP
jgi:HAD superfamily hydrolase (TIGR01509 family)